MANGRPRRSRIRRAGTRALVDEATRPRRGANFGLTVRHRRILAWGWPEYMCGTGFSQAGGELQLREHPSRAPKGRAHPFRTPSPDVAGECFQNQPERPWRIVDPRTRARCPRRLRLSHRTLLCGVDRSRLQRLRGSGANTLTRTGGPDTNFTPAQATGRGGPCPRVPGVPDQRPEFVFVSGCQGYRQRARGLPLKHPVRDASTGGAREKVTRYAARVLQYGLEWRAWLFAYH